MRAYFEKPRTVTGWTGLLCDPGMDGSLRRAPGAAGGAATAGRHRHAGPADSVRVPQPGGPALFLRRGDLGGDRRPHHREPGPPPARLVPADAGGLQERLRRRRPGRRRGMPGRSGRAHVPRDHQGRHDRDSQQPGQSRLPCRAARRPERAELLSGRRGQRAGRGRGRRAATPGHGRREPRQQRQGPPAAGNRRHRGRRAGRRRGTRDCRGDAGKQPGGGQAGAGPAVRAWSTGRASPTRAWTVSATMSVLEALAAAVRARRATAGVSGE